MTTRGAGRVHYAWVILGGTVLALLAASGMRSVVGELSGWIFFSDQIGSAVGSLMVLAIRERPASRRPPAMLVAVSAHGV